MAEVINTNVFDANKKFVDFAGLDYFWDKSKAYIDAADKATSDRVDDLETVVGSTASGLVKDVKAIQTELKSLSGGAGSIATQINNAIAELDVEDTAVTGQYVSSVSEVDGKIAVTRAALPDYTADFAAKANVSDLTAHVGNTVAHITAAERTAWNTAEQNAKTYADGLNTAMDGRVDALEAQDKYVATEVTAAINKAQEDAQTYANGLNTVMDGRVGKLEVIDHKAIATQAAADAVAAVVANAPEDFNTLKEVADYIAADKTKASKIETAISDLCKADEAIRGEFAAADDQVLVDAKSYADSLVKDSEGKSLFDAAGAAATAKSEAIAAAATDATTKANAALAAAKADADGKFQVAGNYEEAGAAAGALNDAKKYTDAAVAAIVAVSNTDIDVIFA